MSKRCTHCFRHHRRQNQGVGRKMNLDKIKLRFSPLSEKVYLMRHGKNEYLALDKREAEHDVHVLLCGMALHYANTTGKGFS